ncbi:hypothetical protein GIB67_005976 [Kingdonia uniflora]|uniref:Uncharacterized protein n=1 Tax=Kingdonia uniflora TaxID=39325 RepID=A0A7J7MBW4_9MAGN|nr:hypothetical protein GIB67_005976 [Kingdonia uniflora]
MANSSKFDVSSGISNKPIYPSGQRRASMASSLDRSGSFRESTENRTLPSVPSTSRTGSSVSHGDLLNIVRGLSFDANMLYTSQKFSPNIEVNRLISGALGMSSDGSLLGTVNTKMLPSSSMEELKRIKASLQDESVAARDRTRNLNEVISKFDKGIQNVISRKRSRSDVAASDRSNAMLAGDRLVLGGSTGKARTQSNQISNGYDIETQNLEARTKNGTPNKRIRTSMLDGQMDARSNALQRPSGVTDRDKEIIGHTNVVQPEEKDRTLSIGGDGWEKSKMKKKRSGIKTDAISTGDLDGDRDSKREVQRKLSNDVRSRSSNSHGFRSGVSSGASGLGKLDAISQHTDLGIRSIPRSDQDNVSFSDDRRDRPIGSDKERVSVKAINKPHVGEPNSSTCPVTTTKVNTSIRTPRSGPATVSKSSPYVHQAIPNDWELSSSPNNRKRTPSARSSSPPVAQWAGQRPQKISRVARRSNLIPLVSSNDEALASGAIANVSPQHVKLRGDNVSSAALSESEESGAAEIKSKDKGKKYSQVEEKDGHSALGVANLVSSSRKNNKMPVGKLEDGVRRQGRTIRGFTSPRSGVRMPGERVDNSATAKQVRSARFGLDKIESKAGRPPTKKLSERKTYTRPKHAVNDAALDFSVEPDDGHAELLAAANTALNPACASFNLFWRQVEPSFGYVSAEDMSFLKQQGDLGSSSPIPTIVSTCKVDSNPLCNGIGLTECERDLELAREVKLEPSEDNPLYQRVMAALISEEVAEELFCNGDEDFKFDDYGNTFEIDDGSESDSWNQQSLGSIQTVGRPASNGYRITATRRYIDEVEQDESDCADITGDLNVGMVSNFGRSLICLQKNQAVQPDMACSEFQYKQMSLDERTLLEVQSIGIFPELKPGITAREGEQMEEEIMRLNENLHEVVSKMKPLVSKLEKSAMCAREFQEREIESCALDKLVGMSYDKYMTCFGRNASCGKGTSAKLAKQAARSFVNQTLYRCQKFENTGESCFNDPVFKDMFRSVSTHVNSVERAGRIVEEESLKIVANTPIRPSELRVSASQGPQHVPSPISQSGLYIDNRDFQSINCFSDQITCKEDFGANRVKKRELLLDDLGGTIAGSLPTGTKGKRSERDREGKRSERETISRNGTAKIGRTSLTNNSKGERKPKVKSKQKTTHLSASVNVLGNKASENKPFEMAITNSNNVKKKNEFCVDTDSEALDLSNLPDDLDGQGEDLASWLNIDDDALLDDDFMGLEIPMDDLSDLNMMV